jgi:oligopeptide transport system ATP-binding protein
VSAAALLRVEHLSVRFPVRGAVDGQLRALEDVSFAIEPGKTLGIVGESGCGKSTLARALLRLVPIAAGRLEFDGRDYTFDDERALRALRRAVRLVFQDPLASLNPRFTVGQSVREPLEIFEPSLSRVECDRAVAAALERVGLGGGYAQRYPHELSGGQNQRVSIARALIGAPRLLLCDESVSALDVSVQAQILNLLSDLQRDTGVSIVFISHDLSVVKHISHRLLVLYLGRVMEYGAASTVFAAPRHPYTQSLLDAVPIADPIGERERAARLAPLVGDLPSPLNPPSGCVFRTRCPVATRQCGIAAPALTTLSDAQYACHHPRV